jgi:hypothetical protein
MNCDASVRKAETRRLTWRNVNCQTTTTNEVLTVFRGKSEGIGTNEKGLTAAIGNQSYQAPQTVSLSNRFIEDVMKLFELEPVLKVESLREEMA